YLRRKDAQLSKMWKAHIAKVLTLMIVVYRRWIRKGWMREVESLREMNFVVNVLLATASLFLQFFESADRQPARKHVENGKVYVARLIVPRTSGDMKADFEKFIEQAPVG